MNFVKLTFVLLIIALTYLAVAESRAQHKKNNNSRYRLFKSRPSRHHLGQGRQSTDNGNSIDKNSENDYDDIGDELDNLELDENNRIFFFMKNKQTTTTAAPTTTTVTTPTDDPVTPPDDPVTPPDDPVTPPDAVPPEGPPTPPTVRSFDDTYNQYRHFDF